MGRDRIQGVWQRQEQDEPRRPTSGVPEPQKVEQCGESLDRTDQEKGDEWDEKATCLREWPGQEQQQRARRNETGQSSPLGVKRPPPANGDDGREGDCATRGQGRDERSIHVNGRDLNERAKKLVGNPSRIKEELVPQQREQPIKLE